jgi:hypothetical protein
MHYGSLDIGIAFLSYLLGRATVGREELHIAEDGGVLIVVYFTQREFGGLGYHSQHVERTLYSWLGATRNEKTQKTFL